MKYQTQNFRYTSQNLFGARRYNIDKSRPFRRVETNPGYKLPESDPPSESNKKEENISQNEKRKAREDGINELEAYIQDNAQYLSDDQMKALEASVRAFRHKLTYEATDEQQTSALKSLDQARKTISAIVAKNKKPSRVSYSTKRAEKVVSHVPLVLTDREEFRGIKEKGSVRENRHAATPRGNVVTSGRSLKSHSQQNAKFYQREGVKQQNFIDRQNDFDTAQKGNVKDFPIQQTEKMKFADELDQNNLASEIYKGPTSAARNKDAATTDQGDLLHADELSQENLNREIYSKPTTARKTSQKKKGFWGRLKGFFGR